MEMITAQNVSDIIDGCCSSMNKKSNGMLDVFKTVRNSNGFMSLQHAQFVIALRSDKLYSSLLWKMETKSNVAMQGFVWLFSDLITCFSQQRSC